MVGRGMPGRRRGHVAQDDIGETAQRSGERGRRRRITNIGTKQSGAGKRRGLGDIDANDRATTADPRDGDLCPATWSAAKIDDTPARPQQTKALVELDQLECGTRAVAEPARFGDIGIVQLA